MQTIIWASSSIVLLTLIISFLPLGYTKKGKLIIVLTSLLLTVGGLATVSIIPLWETALILFALIFFAAYFMNKRIGALILNENNVFGEVLDEEYESHEHVYEIESIKDINLVKIDEELALPISSNINLEKDNVWDLMATKTNNEVGTIDEDISSLLERNIDIDLNGQNYETEMKNGYLSDIESLLELEIKQADLLENIQNISPVLAKEKSPTQLDEEIEKPLDDTLFDFILLQKEVAADRNTLEEIAPKKMVSLQK